MNICESISGRLVFRAMIKSKPWFFSCLGKKINGFCKEVFVEQVESSKSLAFTNKLDKWNYSFVMVLHISWRDTQDFFFSLIKERKRLSFFSLSKNWCLDIQPN